MAVTENSFTGNGSTTNYAFTFPYLKSTDIQVQLNATVTTNWSLANATTIQFTAPSGGATTTQESGGAPKTGVAIKILRKTNVDNLAATFYAGSSIKSEDLNDNYTQNLYVTQEIGNRSFENTGLSTMIGDLQMGEDTNVVFEGATDNDYETTLTVADPTADRTITIPNVTGTVVTTGDTGTVTSTMIADSTIASGDIADNAVIRAKIVADAVDGTKIADDAIDSEHIAADSIDTEHYAPNSVDTTALAADAVTGAQIADDAVDSEHLAADSIDAEHYAPGSVDATALASNAVTAVKINADAIDGTKIADDAINSEHITDGSIDHVHLAADIIDGDNIQDDVINSEHIAAGAVDLEHMSADSVDSDQYVDGSIDRVHLEADIIDSTKLADNAVGTEHIADAELTTLAGMQSGTASILAGGTALTSTLSELNLLDGKSIVTTISSPTDVQIPTAQAVDERIIDLVTDVGGFRPIANETSFPATNPDPEDNAGTIVSVKALASNLTSNGSGVATIANGAGSGNTVTITGMANSDTIEAGKGILVETTSTLHTYTFHRETLAPADITAANTAVSDFNNRYRILASGTNINTVGSLDDGDLLWDSNVDKMKVYDATASEWKEVTSTGEFKYLFLCPTGGTGAPTYGGASYDLREASNSGSVASVTTAAQLLVSVNGVIQKANTGTSAPAEGFAMVDGNSIIFGSNIASTDSVFIVQVGSAVSIPTPGDDTVSTVKIQNGAVNADKLASGVADVVNDTSPQLGGDLDIQARKITTSTTDGNITLEPNGDGDIKVGNSGAQAVIQSVSTTDSFVVKGSHSYIQIDGGVNGGISILPNGTGGVDLGGSTTKLGLGNTEQKLTTHMSGAHINIEPAGTSGNIKVKSGANEDIEITPNGTGDVVIDGLKYPQADGSTGQFLKTDGSAQLSWADASVGGATGTDYNDDVKVRFGTGNDLEIYHDGTSGYIKGSGAACGGIIIDNSADADQNIELKAGQDVYLKVSDGSETAVRCERGGKVELYHDNSKKVETTSTGLKTYTGGTTGVVDSLELEASGNGGSGRGVGIKFSAPGSSNSVHVADIEGLMETAANTATSAQLLFKVAKTDGTLTERMRLQPGGVTCISSTETTGHNNGTKTLYIQGEETNNVNHICRINNKSTSSDSDDTAPLFLTKGSSTNDSNCWFAAFGISAVNGSGNATGSGGIGANGGQNAQFISISDNRLKENITPVTGAIDKIKAITPVSFDWIEKKNEETGEIENSTGHINYGFTAQDVETTFPEYVSTTKRKIGDVENVKSLSGGMTAGYVSVLTAALKEAITKIETLETKVAALEAK